MSLRVSRIAHVGLTVSDIERSIQIFRDVLGFRLTRRSHLSAPFSDVTGVKDADIRAAFLTGGEPAFTVELLQYDCPDCLRTGSVVKASSNIGSAHLAFEVDDMLTAAKRMKQAGLELIGGPKPIPGGPSQGTLVAYLRDWDGHTFELMQPPTATTLAAYRDEV